MGKQLPVVDAAKNISVSDVQVSSRAARPRSPISSRSARARRLTGTFLPVVHRATSELRLVDKYERLSLKAQDMGVYHPDDPTIDHYVTRKALDGVYLMIGEEERKICRDPVGTGSALLGKVFGALR